MLDKGLLLTLNLALQEMGSIPLDRYDAWVEGLYREDVVVLPFIGTTFSSPSWRHLWPRSRRYGAHLFKKAVSLRRRGDLRGGDRMLGRACHVLIDMAVPVHAQAVWHYLQDPFELYVEAHDEELSRLPVPPLPHGMRSANPEQLTDFLASVARLERVDDTQSPWGRILRSLGLRDRPKQLQVADQARRLIPLASAHVKLLIENYERESA